MPSNTLMGAVGELAASRHGAFSRRQAASIGITSAAVRDLIRHRVVTEPAPRVLVVTSHAETWRQRMSIATLCCNSAGIGAFESSGALHGIDGCAEGPVVLLLPAARRIQYGGVRTHIGPIDDIDVTMVDGIPCTSLERTICDLGSVLPPYFARLAFEWYWRRTGDLAPLQQAVHRVHRPGQRGTKVVQALLVDARVKRVPTESGLEVHVEAVIGDLPGIVRQHQVFDETGRFVARVDFAFPDLRLAIEAHSIEFHSGPAAYARDLERHQDLTETGWRVRYVTAAELADPLRLRSAVHRLTRNNERPSLPFLPFLT